MIGPVFGAAGVLPRLDVYRSTNLASGASDEVEGDLVKGTTVDLLPGCITGTNVSIRQSSFGGTTFALAHVAPIVALRRTGVPFFALGSVVVLVMTPRSPPSTRPSISCSRVRSCTSTIRNGGSRS